MFHQATSEAPWQIALATERERVTNELKPEFVTVLSADNDFTSEMTWDVASRIKYTGPSYFDFDSTDLNEVIPKFIEFLNLIQGKGVDLSSCRLFATGGKGFHLEMPLETLKDRVPKVGITGLPYVLKEMANDLFINTLDMRVYTGKRGRMWRVPNIKRSNGHYKVPITPAEAFAMTPELYLEFTSAPRSAPLIAPPKFCGTLAVLFSMAENKVGEGLKKRKAAKGNAELIQSFAGHTPRTLELIMNGEGLAQGASFQRIALQLGIAANSFNIKEEAFLAKCEGLCQKHQSDGDRYNTPSKRRAELKRMYRYCDGNPMYEFAVGPLRSLLDPQFSLAEFAAKEPSSDPDEAVSDVQEPGAEVSAIGNAIRLNSKGLFVKSQDGGWMKASDLGLSNPRHLKDAVEGGSIGYEVDVMVEGKSKGSHLLSINTLQSRQRFMEWGSGLTSASVQASDNQVTMMMDVLRRKTEKNPRGEVLVVQREGLDVIQPYGATADDLDLIWCAKDICFSRSGREYRMRNSVTGKARSDLHSAPDMVNSESMKETMRCLLNFNNKMAVAQSLGYYIACFLCQPIRYLEEKFPMLELHGPAGAGKSSTASMLQQFHTHMTKINLMSAGGCSTTFAIQSALSMSASIPVIVDEFKPRDLDPRRVSEFRDLARNNYTGGRVAKGNVNKDSGASKLVVVEDTNAAPLVFIGEALDTETAMRERVIEVSLTKETRAGRTHENSFQFLMRHRSEMASIGKKIMTLILSDRFSFLELRARLDHYVDEVRKRCPDYSGLDRPIFNAAVNLVGLDFFNTGTSDVMGNEFTSQIEDLEHTLLGGVLDVMPEVLSEMSKALDIMSRMSRGTGTDDTTLIHGRDYVYNENGTIEISARDCYLKYRIFCGVLRDRPLYDTVGAFLMALKQYGGARPCPASLLRLSSVTPVFALSLPWLEKEKVEPFKRTSR